MAAIPLEKDVYYPESDGEPMAETKHHLQEMVYVWESLEDRFEAEPDVFVGANMFLYFRKGDPTGVVAPDGFVVKGVPKRWPGGRERTKYLLWEEKQAPCFVLETTSESTHRKDEEKKEIYRRLGVTEYFQFDPYGEYLDPCLQGVRLVRGRYRTIRTEPDGSLLSQTTGVLFRAEGDRLLLMDAVPEEPLDLQPNTRVRLTVETGSESKSAEYSFLRVAQSLNLEGPPDWSERIEDYLERD